MKNEMVVTLVAGLVAAGTVWALPNESRRGECAAQAERLIEQMTPAEMLSQLMMDSKAIDRLGVKAYYWWNEALHGDARAGLATVFPQSIGAAATFDPELLEKVGDAVSTEARAKYNLFSAKGDRRLYRGLTFWSPNVNLFRDPRWGRGQETLGEDPYLTGVMGGAYVRGLQGYDRKYLKTAACAKHFAVHSGPEKLRHGFNVNPSKRDLFEYYLPAFKSLVMDAKVESIMSAYSGLYGRSCTGNKYLLTDVLRNEWGFLGHVVSDYGAVVDIFRGHHHVDSPAAASLAAMDAGVDLCSEDTYLSLTNLVASGKLAPARMKKPLTHLYTTRALLGQFDPPGSTPWDRLGAEAVNTPEHQALALREAEESLVLISNKNGVLPLDRERLSTMGVFGPRTFDEEALYGNYCTYAAQPISCMSGLIREAGPAVRVTTEPEIGGADYRVDALVACIGINANDEGEEGCSINNDGGDRSNYQIPDNQLAKLREYRKNYPKAPLIAVVFGGSPFDLKPVVEICDAVMLAWYPGEQGGAAIARAIFGEVNPSGRLPITYPKSYADLPDFADYSLIGRTYRYATKEPLYPFGYGLSYTKFAYAGGKVEVKGQGQERKAIVSVSVKNVGKRAGEEVVQAYVRAPAVAGDRRRHHLEGFKRVKLAPGEAKEVTIVLPVSAFAVFDEAGRPQLPKGESTVFVGGGQPGFTETVSLAVGW